MTAADLRPFADEHLDGAAALLAERHARHREAEPLLPPLADARAELEKEWRGEGASGAVALDAEGAVTGYLVGHRRSDPAGPHVWSYVAGHAARDPELLRDLYAAASPGWVEAGLTRHFVYAPAIDELVDPWFRLSFGASAVLATRETAVEPPAGGGVLVRDGTPADIEAAVRLERAMTESMQPAPSFSSFEPQPAEEALAEWEGTWEDTDTYRHFVAERDGRVVGHLLLYRRPPDLRVPADSIDLAQASTDPAERGSGVGVALTRHALAWAHEHGYPTMITDWRMTNLLASRFWPRRGFRPVFLRLYRSIP